MYGLVLFGVALVTCVLACSLCFSTLHTYGVLIVQLVTACCLLSVLLAFVVAILAGAGLRGVLHRRFSA